MAKWSGKIGYIKTEEVERGVCAKGVPTERQYFGDIFSDDVQIQQSMESTNNIITLANKVSIVADNFANENFGYMKYAVVRGCKWRITDVKVQYPRLILTIGGMYNGK